MGASGEIQYTFRSTCPDVLERGRTQTIAMEAYLDAVLVAPLSGALSLAGPTGQTIVSARPVVVLGDVATCEILSSDLSDDVPLAEGYREHWALAMPDGTTRTVLREAAVARYTIHPPAGDVDLLGEYPEIAGELRGLEGYTGLTVQRVLDEAWTQLLGRLWARDRWPDLVVNTSALRAPLRQLALHLVFKQLYRMGVQGDVADRLMELHWTRYEDAWAELALRWDRDQDGRADALQRERAGAGVVHRHVGPRAARGPSRDPRW